MPDVTLPLRYKMDGPEEWVAGICTCGYATDWHGSIRGVRRQSFEHLYVRHPRLLDRIIEANLTQGVPA